MPSARELVAEIMDGPSGPDVAAFFDFDGTVIDGYSIAAFYEQRLRKFEVSPMEVIQLLVARSQGELDENKFTTLAEQAAKVWAGRSEDELDELGQRLLVQKLGASLYPEAWDIVQAHRRKGHTVVMASAASRFQVAPMANELGVEHILCSQFESEDGMLTGRLAAPPLWGSRKADAVHKFAAERGIDLATSHGYGNGNEDVGFLETVGLPHPVNPQPRLAAVAAERGWPVVTFARRGRPGLVQFARSLAVYGTMATVGATGLSFGLLNRNRRQGIDLATGMLGDLTLAVAGVQVKVQGTEHLWSNRPAVFIFNHQSGIDMLVLSKLIREGFTGVAKKELAKTPGFGQAFKWADVAFVERGNTKQAKEALAPAVDKLRNGISIVLSPEGTRSATPRLGPFKKGAFHLAMQAGVPIVPIVIRNAGEVMWRTSKTVRPGRVDVVVHPPISVTKWTVTQLDKRVAEVRQLFLDTLDSWPAANERS